jgi:DNA recombination protein RmuC
MTITLGAIISFFIGFILGGLILWFVQRNRSNPLNDQALATLREEKIRLETEIQKDRQSFQEKLSFFDQLKTEFEALSAKALKDNNQSFLDLAKQKLETLQTEAKGELEQRKQSIASMMEPVKSSLEKFEQHIQAIETKREGAYSGLAQQIDFLQKSNSELKSAATNLSQALRSSSQVRGSWGEYQLRNIIEMAGMLKYCDFTEQSSTSNEDGRIRPDVVIRLPGSGNIVIDAKTPSMMELHDAINASDPEVKKQKLQAMTFQIRDHVAKLGKKNYWESFQPSPDFVLLFLPTDAMYIAALEQDPKLLEAGSQSKVFITTPTSLIALLRCIAVGWQQVQIARDAAEIGRLGKELYERISSMSSHFTDLGKKLGGAVDAYNKTVASIETRMLPTARKFQSLQQVGTQEIALIESLEQAPREPQAEELKHKDTVRLIKD